MQTYSNHLQESVDCYQSVLAITHEIEKSLLDIKAPVLQSLTERFDKAMDKARQVDTFLQAQPHDLTNEEDELLQQRLQLIHCILEQNNKLNPLLQQARALSRNEMEKLHLGRKTTGSYARQASRSTGNLINNSS